MMQWQKKIFICTLYTIKSLPIPRTVSILGDAFSYSLMKDM